MDTAVSAYPASIAVYEFLVCNCACASLCEYQAVAKHTYIHTYIQTYINTDLHTYIQTYRQTDMQADRQADRHADRQIDRHTSSQVGKLLV